MSGLAAAWRHEHAFRQELLLFVVLAIVSFFCPVTRLERLAMIAALALVLIVELLNSAIEAVVDLVSPQFHPLAKQAKDIGSAAVWLSLVLAGLVWLVVLGPLLPLLGPVSAR